MLNKDTVEEFWKEATVQNCFQSGNSIRTEDFIQKLGEFLVVNHPIWAMASARLALEKFLLAAMPEEKSTVLICSFNCPVVADAAIRAGFSLETYDLADSTGRIDWHQLEKQLKPDYGAIVIPHLFGVPCDFRPILQSAKTQGTLIVEDCAHTFGGYIGQQIVGTLGDAAIFSFNYDKPLSLGGGGALLVNNLELWEKIRFTHQLNSVEVERQELSAFVAYLHDRRKRISHQGKNQKILSRVLQKLKLDRYRSLLPTNGIGPIRAALGMWQLERYSQIIQKRNTNANFFHGRENYQSWYVSPDVRPAWLKQKIIPPNFEQSTALSQRLQSQGIRVGNFNWSKTIDSYLKRPEKENAAFSAKYALDIPIHQNMTMAQLNYIHSVVVESAGT